MDLKIMAARVKAAGVGGDTELMHVNAGEALWIRKNLGPGKVNPHTGLEMHASDPYQKVWDMPGIAPLDYSAPKPSAQRSADDAAVLMGADAKVAQSNMTSVAGINASALADAQKFLGLNSDLGKMYYKAISDLDPTMVTKTISVAQAATDAANRLTAQYGERVGASLTQSADIAMQLGNRAMEYLTKGVSAETINTALMRLSEGRNMVSDQKDQLAALLTYGELGQKGTAFGSDLAAGASSLWRNLVDTTKAGADTLTGGIAKYSEFVKSLLPPMLTDPSAAYDRGVTTRAASSLLDPNAGSRLAAAGMVADASMYGDAARLELARREYNTDLSAAQLTGAASNLSLGTQSRAAEFQASQLERRAASDAQTKSLLAYTASKNSAYNTAYGTAWAPTIASSSVPGAMEQIAKVAAGSAAARAVSWRAFA